MLSPVKAPDEIAPQDAERIGGRLDRQVCFGLLGDDRFGARPIPWRQCFQEDVGIRDDKTSCKLWPTKPVQENCTGECGTGFAAFLALPLMAVS